ncbi:MAG: ATP-dependent 6-phosphofructokinase [Gemmatimonadota bacterium]|nr:ATP-dependent 6-phosphofructokinase [Gemmatimonadota bacterium]
MLKIAIATTGGDAPGLNAVIRGATATAHRLGFEIVGLRNGFDTLLHHDRVEPLTLERTQGIERTGGTILGGASRGDPFRGYENGPRALKEALDRHGIDAVVIAGGDGSLAIAHDLAQAGIRMVVAPKTIDRDVANTHRTFGFESAVEFATLAIERLHATAASHERLFVCEVMGRDVGWIALYAGLAAGAHLIVIPEIPYHVDRLADHIRRRESEGHCYHILVCTEGARPADGSTFLSERTGRYSGVAEALASQLGERTGKDARAISLGHLLRGGDPTALDRILGLGFGARAVQALHEGESNVMIALHPPDLVTIPIAESAGKLHRVNPQSHEMLTARNLGIAFGD